MTSQKKTQGASSQRGMQAGAEPATRLENRTREELFELARRLEIPGHTEMDKAELVEAIRRR